MRELLTTKTSNYYWPSHWGKDTNVMAIVNITPDSFSDGGLFNDLNSAVEHATLCIEQGAQILDIGAQSTRPGAEEVGIELSLIHI